MCQCLSFFLHPVLSQRLSSWRRDVLRFFVRIRSYQRAFSGVEVEIFRTARQRSSDSTGRSAGLRPYRFQLRARRMGACMSANGKGLSKDGNKYRASKGLSTDSGKSSNSRKKEAKVTETVAASNTHLDQLLHRLSGNGASDVACLFTQQGRKGVNQDAMLVWENFGSREDTVFCGVFDGHGPYGHLVAQSVRDLLPAKLVSSYQTLRSAVKDPTVVSNGNVGNLGDENGLATSLDGNEKVSAEEHIKGEGTEAFSVWKASILQAYKLMDKELRAKPNIDCFCSGTTAVALVKQGNYVIIGNVGDSRAVLGTKLDNNSLMAVQLTVDLKPNLPQEAERIKECKGRVFALQDEPEVHRVWLPHDNSPGLAMARAFGDFCLKNFGLIAIPDITYRQLTGRDQFIVLATDGVWDVLTNEQVVEIVASVPARPLAARAVVDTAVRAWRSKYPTSKVDDCAVVCFYVDNMPTGPCYATSKLDSPTKQHSNIVYENSKQVETSGPSAENGSKAEDCPVQCATTDSRDDDNKSSQPEPADLETENDWLALEGVSRVNSLVNLPRFGPGDKRSGG